jgi:hypothetical protein
MLNYEQRLGTPQSYSQRYRSLLRGENDSIVSKWCNVGENNSDYGSEIKGIGCHPVGKK